VIAGQECGRETGAGDPSAELGEELDGVFGTGAGAGVEGVTVEHDVRDAVEEWAELRQAADAARAVAIVDVGKNADEWAGHEIGSAVC
jgi:hypothetical protein